MSANPKDFWIGKEVFWVYYDDNNLYLKSGLITQFSSKNAIIHWRNRKKWTIFAHMDYTMINIDFLAHSKQEAIDLLKKKVEEL